MEDDGFVLWESNASRSTWRRRSPIVDPTKSVKPYVAAKG